MSNRAVLMARVFFVVAGSVLLGLGVYLEATSIQVIRILGFGLEVIGAVVLGFGAFARGRICVDVFQRLLHFLGKRLP